ncbi:hypothetical protein GSI_01149 [Ganoderma sinense ZZ0214-1]|uniref:Uncharacterized protein n=1 Tax=Ganoderma sinense ZZ0214-1 TaxID=1077348 RepID=A0A2G8SUK4_9APHY|nr:hypothetical protein GSI_01149 [Ganoderma sinense ZZ0214-1]
MSPTQTPGERSAPEVTGAAGADPSQLDPITKAYIDQKFEEADAHRHTPSTTAPAKLKELEVFDGDRARYLSWKRLSLSRTFRLAPTLASLFPFLDGLLPMSSLWSFVAS